MSATPTKRLRELESASAKRSRMERIARLCDLRAGPELFSSKLNAARAKEKGYIRNREASGKYEELERKLFAIFKESGDLDFPDEDWVFDVLPELSNLESDTLDSLLEQAQQHAKYENAARELVMLERCKLDDEHQQQLRALRAQMETEQARKEVTSDMEMNKLEEQSRADLESLRAEATEKIHELEGVIEELEETVTKQNDRMKEMEQEAEAEADRLREEGATMVAKLEQAQEETDLKRETSRKLKEEIIDNDRLTVANLNRIKNLETLVERHKAALEEVESENAELRAELSTRIDPKEAEAELSTLRELLSEREEQLIAMSRRLSDALEDNENIGFSRAPGRRDSFLDRFGIGSKGTLTSSS